MTYEYGFEKPEEWGDDDVVAFATLAGESDDDYEEVAVVEVAAMSADEGSVA
jgi:hypothetical protein